MPDPVFVPQNAATSHMDWDSPDKAAAFTKIKRKCELLFKSYYKSVTKEEQTIVSSYGLLMKVTTSSQPSLWTQMQIPSTQTKS